ncbi:MAG: hypothetical protein Q4C70_08505, partial [Planctomycetia bacterium]|nr:hypothetical protein [Planctomycetia bacterium]
KTEEEGEVAEAEMTSDDLFDLSVPGEDSEILDVSEVAEMTKNAENKEGSEKKQDSEIPSKEELAQRIHDLKNLNEQKKWRLDELKNVREEAEKEFQASRIALSTTQENRNKRLEELESFREALVRLQSQPENTDAGTIQAEIEKKKAEEERLLKELEQAENTAKKQNGSYAILPYAGANGTRRYPIYIECREDGAWLMPENIQLVPRDFEGALSMENPLEMALMAKRQYLLRNGVFQETHDNAQEPYPLIIVRPGGIMYLYMVRSALQSWKSEYGYELVEKELPVAYPPNDENLKREMSVAIQRGRERQRELAAMAPTIPHTANGGRGGVVYHPTSQGGVAMSVDKDSRLARTLQRSSAQVAARNAAAQRNAQLAENGNGNGRGNDAGTGNGIGTGSETGTDAENRVPRNTAGEMYVADVRNIPTASRSVPRSAPHSGAYGANGNIHGGKNGYENGIQNGNRIQNGTPGLQNGSQNPNGEELGDGAIAATAVNNLNMWSVANADGNRDGNGNGTQNGKNVQNSGNGINLEGAVCNNPSGGAVGDSISGTDTPSTPGAQNGPVSQNIAEKEGQNWALENYRPNLTSLTRPLPMECHADRFILSGTPGFDQVVIPISTPIPTVKRLAKEIGGKIKGWGDAGRGAYWKPILRVRVAPDAREQFALLQEMLRGSGLVVEEVK